MDFIEDVIVGLRNRPDFIARFGEQAPEVARTLAEFVGHVNELQARVVTELAEQTGELLTIDELYAWFAQALADSTQAEEMDKFENLVTSAHRQAKQERQQS